ncbi:MAG: hypothetical protein JSU94_12015 [Phycisphaerales bacterium]|nr:MAG: hypothetical protein JSU94_12015 [Phycisphaerales bacterium]
MATDDFNLVKPVESLQNIGALTPVKQGKEKKNRQDFRGQNQKKRKQEPNDASDEMSEKQTTSEEPNEHSIDYCA